MYKLDLKTRICNNTVPHRGWIPRGTHPGDKFLSTNLVGASGYPKEKLTVLQFVSNKTDGKFIHEFIIRPLIMYIFFASDTVTYKTLIYQKYPTYIVFIQNIPTYIIFIQNIPTYIILKRSTLTYCIFFIIITNSILFSYGTILNGTFSNQYVTQIIIM